MEPKILAAGYVRVSTSNQVIEGESLTTQRSTIEDFCKRNDFNLTQIYADEGISGGSVKDRLALQRCIRDGQSGKFSLLIVLRLSRFGRNAKELLENYEALNHAGIELRSISEGIDFSSTYGRFMLTMLAAIAELDRDIIRETTLENKIAKAKRGFNSFGSVPYGRIYHKETGEWTLDVSAAEKISLAADKYLKGGQLLEIAKSVGLTKSALIHIFRGSGDTWAPSFAGQDPIIFKVPRLLPDDVIEKVKDRLEFKRTNNRTDKENKYILSGFVRCNTCSGLLTGITQINYGKEFKYYKHVSKTISSCPDRPHLTAILIEKAVFETIRENIMDVPSFEQSITDSIPDDTMRKELDLNIKSEERELKRITKELDLLVESVLNKTLTPDTIKKKESELLKQQAVVSETLESHKLQFNNLPDPNVVKQEANYLRNQLMEYASSKEHMENLTFEEKRTILHSLFDGKDQKGTPYGIYVSKIGKGKEQQIDYFMYGRITGLRTLKGNNIDYQGENSNYKTRSAGPGLRIFLR
jgi:site-specific DNA recombinase